MNQHVRETVNKRSVLINLINRQMGVGYSCIYNSFQTSEIVKNLRLTRTLPLQGNSTIDYSSAALNWDNKVTVRFGQSSNLVGCSHYHEDVFFIYKNVDLKRESKVAKAQLPSTRNFAWKPYSSDREIVHMDCGGYFSIRETGSMKYTRKFSAINDYPMSEDSYTSNRHFDLHENMPHVAYVITARGKVSSQDFRKDNCDKILDLKKHQDYRLVMNPRKCHEFCVTTKSFRKKRKDVLIYDKRNTSTALHNLWMYCPTWKNMEDYLDAYRASYSHDGLKLAVSSNYGYANVFDLKGPTITSKLYDASNVAWLRHGGVNISDAKFLGFDGDFLIARNVPFSFPETEEDPNLKSHILIWDVKSHELIKQIQFNDRYIAFDIHPNQRSFIVADLKQTLRIFSS